MHLNLRSKFFYCKDENFWPVYLFEDIEMAVVGDDILGIGGNGTVNKLVVVDILLNQTEMDIGFLEVGCVQPGNGLHHVVGNFLGSLLCKDFFVFNQYFSIDTKGDVATQHTRPYLVIWAVGRQCL